MSSSCARCALGLRGRVVSLTAPHLRRLLPAQMDGAFSCSTRIRTPPPPPPKAGHIVDPGFPWRRRSPSEGRGPHAGLQKPSQRLSALCMAWQAPSATPAPRPEGRHRSRQNWDPAALLPESSPWEFAGGLALWQQRENMSLEFAAKVETNC